MKAVILAGGFGTRISEETDNIPKPMVQIGGMPILWHIMKIYSFYGINDFIVCCGYKGYKIREYFSNYFLHKSDVTFSMSDNKMKVLNKRSEPWTVTLVDTGESIMTGGRIKKIRQYVKNDEAFCLTYGDGLSDVDIGSLIDYHKKQKTLATLTAVCPPSRFGVLNINNGKVLDFEEKPKGDGPSINGGFFVLSPKVIDLIADDSTIWEQKPMKTLTEQGEMSAFEHNGFWQSMDTLRDKVLLQNLWDRGEAPWKIW